MYVMEGKSGEQVEYLKLESVTSSAEWFMQDWRNEIGSWSQTGTSKQNI